MTPHPPTEPGRATVQTVLGPIDATEMGVTMAHEHLLLDARPSFREPEEASRVAFAHRPVSAEILFELRMAPYTNLDNCALLDEHAAAEEVAQFRDLGGRTVVDPTCEGIGRDPLALQRIARRTGLNVIMGAGYYLVRAHPPEVERESVEWLAERIERDVTEGVGDSGVRAGFIGEIGTSSPIHPQEVKVLRAAARAQAATGVALEVHLDGWAREGNRVLDIVEAEGGDPHKTILCHMNPSGRDGDYQRELAARGAWLEYDMIGIEYFFADQQVQSPSDEDDARAIVERLADGLGDKLLLSQDVFLKMMLTRYGGNGYAHVLRHFVPRLRRHGVDDEAIHAMLVTNPATAFGVPNAEGGAA